MAEETVVNGPEATTDEPVVSAEPTELAVEPEHRETDKENRIPISRAEEMWRKREEKARAKWEAEVLGPMKTKNQEYEKVLSQIAKGQLEFGRQLGVIPPEAPPKPLTQDDLEKILTERMAKVEENQRMMYHQQRISTGWEQVVGKYPKFAGNKRFQDAVLHSYSQNPDLSIPQHAESIVKELLDPYASERASSLQVEREKQLTPDRRVVPSGRGAAGGSGGSKTEAKKSVAQRIQDRLRASREE